VSYGGAVDAGHVWVYALDDDTLTRIATVEIPGAKRATDVLLEDLDHDGNVDLFFRIEPNNDPPSPGGYGVVSNIAQPRVGAEASQSCNGMSDDALWCERSCAASLGLDVLATAETTQLVFAQGNITTHSGSQESGSEFVRLAHDADGWRVADVQTFDEESPFISYMAAQFIDGPRGDRLKPIMGVVRNDFASRMSWVGFDVGDGFEFCQGREGMVSQLAARGTAAPEPECGSFLVTAATIADSAQWASVLLPAVGPVKVRGASWDQCGGDDHAVVRVRPDRPSLAVRRPLEASTLYVEFEAEVPRRADAAVTLFHGQFVSYELPITP
jgi:hypothetical protein